MAALAAQTVSATIKKSWREPELFDDRDYRGVPPERAVARPLPSDATVGGHNLARNRQPRCQDAPKLLQVLPPLLFALWTFLIEVPPGAPSGARKAA